MSQAVFTDTKPDPKHLVRLTDSAKRRQQFVAFLVVAPPLLGTVAAFSLVFRYGLGVVEITTFGTMYLLCMLGITVGFHRYFAHRSFSTSRPFELFLAALGSMASQGPLLFWVSTHRSHHAYSDQDGDPHSPNQHGGGWKGIFLGWWHAHIAWMFSGRMAEWSHFSRDLMRDRGLFRLHQQYFYWVFLGLLLPTFLGGVIDQSWRGAGLGFLWGGLVRMCLVNQASWCVGSICHMFGTRPFATHDHSANNHLVAVLAFGEGLQNNHHAFPSSYAHRVRWWEPDLSATVLLILRAVGLVWDLKFPSERVIQDSRISHNEQAT
jgi:stearoyl-CoA desaturase (delta-9 desaturase)